MFEVSIKEMYIPTVFNDKSIKEALEKEDLLEAKNKIEKIDPSAIIRSTRDTLYSLLLRKRGLNIFNSSDTELHKYLTDLRSIPEEMRIRTALIFDFETTEIYNPYAVSAAFSLYDIKEDRVIEEFYSVINPFSKIEKAAIEVHHITEEEAEKHEGFESIIDKIEQIVSKADILVGQNLKFDLRVFERECIRLNRKNCMIGKTVFDTMIFAKELVCSTNEKGKIKNPDLSEIVDYFKLGKDTESFHNAEYDVMQTREVFAKLINMEINKKEV